MKRLSAAASLLCKTASFVLWDWSCVPVCLLGCWSPLLVL